MAIVAVLAVVAFLLIAAISLLMRGVWQTNAGIRTIDSSSAFQLAEAAVDQAARNLRTADAADDVLAGTLATGTFAIEAQTPIAATRYQVIGRGTSQQLSRRLEAVFELTPQSAFQFAVFGSQQVNVSGHAIVDSYDSRLGLYNNSPGPGHNAGHDGDVGTNATTAGGIAVSGSIFVDGQLAVGAGVADPASVVTGYNPAFITGGTSPPSNTQDVVAQDTVFPMSAVTPPLGMPCPDFTATGNQTTTLAPGTYCYRNLTIQGHATLTASGKVTIYLTGSLSAKGNSTIGIQDDPTKMLFLMGSSSEATLEEGTITGSNIFYGAVYGPQSTINITGNAEVFGSIIARTVNVTGSASLHDDVALSETDDVINRFTVARRAWREL